MLNTTITLQRLAARGYASMLDHYKKVAPHLNESSRTGAGWCERLSPSTQVGGESYSLRCWRSSVYFAASFALLIP